jgi:hypothetical protein
MMNPENDARQPENTATPEDREPSAPVAEAAATSGGGHGKRWIYWGVAGVAVAGGVTVCTMMAPTVASSVIRSRMEGAGLGEVRLTVEEAGPFFARIRELSCSAAEGAVRMANVDVSADYSPLALSTGGSLEDAIIENARVDVDLKALASKGGEGIASAAELPFALPKAMDSIPAKGVLVRGAQVNVISGKEKRVLRVDALARMTPGARSATVSATGDNGDQLLLTLQPGKHGETINAEGSVDPLGWYLTLTGALGKELPQEVGLEAAPLVVQFAADVDNGKPGRWVWVISQPWFQMNNGPVVVSSQDARAGFTGEGEKLVKASAEGEILVQAGGVSVGPFRASAGIDSDGILRLGAERVMMHGEGCSMMLDYCRLASPESGEDGAFSLKGAVKPSWLPADLSTIVTFSENLDGMFVHMTLPRTMLDGVSLPDGWLPGYMNGMKVSGGVDADLYVSIGGLSAGGFAASGRLSTDGASFAVPTSGGQTVAFSGVRVRNARISTSSKGFSIDIPDGFMATNVRFGNLSIDDMQLWPGRVSIPGDAGLDSATANIFGGRFVVAGMRGRFSPAGVFVPSSPFDVQMTGVDLRQVGDYAGGMVMSGLLDATARVSPVVDGSGHLRMSVKSRVESREFAVSVPSLFSASAKNLDAEFEFDNVSDKAGTRARIAFTDRLEVGAFSAAGVSYTGKASLEGWAESSAADLGTSLFKGVFYAAKSDLLLRLDGGDAAAPAWGVSIKGLEGRIAAKLGGDAPAIATDGVLKIASAGVGNLLLSRMEASGRVTPAGLELSAFSGNFCGGRLRMEKFAKEGEGYAFTVSLDGVSAAELAALFPQFKGKVSGILDGSLSFHLSKGVLTIRPGKIAMRASSSGRFAYPETDAILTRMGKMDDMVRTRAANTVGDMVVTSFSVTTGDDGKPVTIRLAGDAATGNGVPIDANIVLNGDVARALEMLLGKGVKVQFSKASE